MGFFNRRKRYRCSYCGVEVGSQIEANDHHASHLPGGDRYGAMFAEGEEEEILAMLRKRDAKPADGGEGE